MYFFETRPEYKSQSEVVEKLKDICKFKTIPWMKGEK
jgi:hypothetical protein